MFFYLYFGDSKTKKSLSFQIFCFGAIWLLLSCWYGFFMFFALSLSFSLYVRIFMSDFFIYQLVFVLLFISEWGFCRVFGAHAFAEAVFLFFSRNQMKCESVIEIPQKCESGMSGSINCITWQICTFWPAQPYGRTTSRRLNNSFLINDQINPENQNVYA